MGEGFLLGFAAASVVWFFALRRQDARIDREIVARREALDGERVRLIFAKYKDERVRLIAPEWGDR